MTTYEFIGFLNQTTVFSDEDQIFVNVSVDNITGDPGGERYYVKALNENTGEWVKVYVSDNDTNPPWDDNIPGDGMYWGFFNVSSGNSSQNSSGPGTFSVLQVSNGDIVNISEDPESELDGDAEIAYISITIESDGGEEENNPPNMPCNEEPSNGSTDRPININISWNCSDPDGDPLTFDIYFANSTPPCQVWQNWSNMSYTPGNLEYNTTYHWYIVAWDDQGASTTGPFWWFLTEDEQGGDPPSPPPGENGTGTIRGFVNDSEGEVVFGATVLINRTDQGQPIEFVCTNETGYYIFDDNVTVGTYDVEVWKEGYEPHTFNNINVFENETSWVNFTIFASGGPGGEGQIDLSLIHI